MFTNPFSPIFGGKPGVFFGRSDILDRFDLAMIEPGSDDRAMIITGTRGSGKTALLEQLSIRASQKSRRVIDLGPENTIAQLIHELEGFDEKTTTISPQASVNLFGTGGSISAGSTSKTTHINRESLQPLLLETCARSKNGLFVSVDEIQKVSLEDVSSLCNAFQMASRKGHDIMLAVAGLPYVHKDITRHEGCTYLRRASHEELSLFTWEEADDALNKAFSGIRGLKANGSIIDRINKCSFGHPYIMQLLGYHLVTRVNNGNPGKKHEISDEELDEAIPNAMLAYEKRALEPLVSELPESAKEYLTAMSKCLDDDRLALTSDISRRLGAPQNKLGRQRAYLIDHGMIAAPEHGRVMFCVPYLADYVQKEPSRATAIETARKRRV